MKLLRVLIFPLVAVLAAFVLGGVFVWLIGDNPFETYRLLIGSAFSWPDGIGYTLFYATPLIFTGLAVAVAFRCGLLNIGAEGQLYVAAFATAWVGIKFGGTVVDVFGTPVNYSWMTLPAFVLVPLAILACVFVYILLWKTKWGYEIRATGANPSAAEYGGISVRKQIVLAMAISGGLAGMVGINEVLGYRHVYYDGFSANYGFVGIAVALLGRNHPVGVFLAAILFAILLRGGIFVDAYTVHVSKDIVDMLQGIIIVFVAAEAMFRGPIKKLGLLRRAKV